LSLIYIYLLFIHISRIKEFTNGPCLSKFFAMHGALPSEPIPPVLQRLLHIGFVFLIRPSSASRYSPRVKVQQFQVTTGLRGCCEMTRGCFGQWRQGGSYCDCWPFRALSFLPQPRANWN